MTHIITRQSLRAANACYSDQQIEQLVPEAGLSVAEVAAKTDVPIADRIWCLLLSAGMTEKDQRLFACRCARRALSGVAAPAPLSLRAVEVAERYAEGTATKEELAAASRDAYYAVDAAYYAAYYAAYADYADYADYAAYYAATYYAGAAYYADAAYYAAAYYAADVDARLAERETQLADLVEVLSK